MFLSYSRRDFAFAEALAAEFERQGGIQPWLDVQRLDPGTDWGAAIDAAIDEADAVVLVASRTALASPYVTSEWQRAVAAGITVHVCVVDTVTLPQALAGCTVHDLRSRFWTRTRAVSELIAAGAVDSAAPVRSLRLVPAPVAALLATCLLIAVTLLIAAGNAMLPGAPELAPRYLSPAGGMIAAMVATSLTSLVVAARVPWRRCSASAVSYNLGFTAVWGYLLVTDGIPGIQQADAQASLGVVLLAVSAVGAVLVTGSRSVYLWMPTGEGYYQVRQRILGLPVRRRRRARVVNPRFAYQWAPFARDLARASGRGVSTTFEVRFDPGDERIAHAITAACVEAGLVERIGPDSWVLRVVSSKTDYARANAEVSALGTRAVCVLADSLRLPEDSVDLRRRQWLDFRQQTPEGLYNLLRLIVGAEHGGMDSAPVPLAPSVSRIPFMVQGFAVAARSNLVGIGAFSVGLCVAAPTVAVFSVGAVSLAPMALLWWQLRTTVARTITGTRFRISVGLLGVSVLLWAGCLGLLHPALWLCGVLELLVLAASFARGLRHLPECWLPESVTPSKAELVQPSVFASYLAPVAVMIFGLAASIPSFLR